jgi:hypothetical protein
MGTTVKPPNQTASSCHPGGLSKDNEVSECAITDETSLDQTSIILVFSLKLSVEA